MSLILHPAGRPFLPTGISGSVTCRKSVHTVTVQIRMALIHFDAKGLPADFGKNRYHTETCTSDTVGLVYMALCLTLPESQFAEHQ